VAVVALFSLWLSGAHYAYAQQASSQRGPLRYTITPSSTRLEASRTFTLNLAVTNPYDRPVRLDSVEIAKNAIFPYLGNFGPGGSQENPQGPFIVQPGSQLVWIFELNTSPDLPQTLFFYPTAYTLHFFVTYAVEDASTALYDDVPYTVDVLVPMHVLIIASTTGALIGALIRDAGSVTGRRARLRVPDLKALISLGSVALLGGVAVVALSRGSGFQAVVSTNDFFGSLVFGVLVGYAGQAAVTALLGRGPFTPTTTDGSAGRNGATLSGQSSGAKVSERPHDSA
jgi:hypothetical protein